VLDSHMYLARRDGVLDEEECRRLERLLERWRQICFDMKHEEICGVREEQINVAGQPAGWMPVIRFSMGEFLLAGGLWANEPLGVRVSVGDDETATVT